MEKITKYAIFNYSEQDQDLINLLDKYINEHAEEIYTFFDSTLFRTQVKINIISTKQQYDEIVQKRRQTIETPTWEIGSYYDGTIEYVSLHDYKSTAHAFSPEKYKESLEYYKKTIMHEFVHFVVGQYIAKNNTNKPLKYLNEGIAQYLSHQRDDINLVFKYSLDEIVNSNNCYLGFFLLTKFIIEEKGKDYFMTLLRNRERAIMETPKLYKEAKFFYDNYENNKNIKV